MRLPDLDGWRRSRLRPQCPGQPGQGWKKQATYDEPRLSEMADTYREIGLEVHMEAFHPDEEPGCTGS